MLYIISWDTMKITKSILADPLMWDIFTKKEEYNPIFLDQYGRFSHSQSMHRNVMAPIISKFLYSTGTKPDYPDGKKFAVCLTHDIDAIKQGIKANTIKSFSSVKKGDLKSAVQYSFNAFNKKQHPYWNFEQIMDIESQYDAKSSFYFLALKPGEMDYNYDLEEVKDDIRNIADRGWEVGLHGGHNSYNKFDDMVHKKKMLEDILGSNIVGYRNHYLRFKMPDTWEHLSKAGFKYDATFGYHDCIGFRNGMCHPFKPFNLNTKKEIDILEIPLNIMDRTLFENYMRLDTKTAWMLAKKMIDTVENYNGVITFLWHNTYMQGNGLKFYEKILKYCSEKNAWITSGKEIYEFWERNICNLD